jgi:lipopolysaccharide transport system permease protein
MTEQKDTWPAHATHRYTTVIVPEGEGNPLYLRELIGSGDLLYAFVVRAWKVRYKQTVIGATWAIIQPVALMIVFSVFFGLLIRVPSGDLPYPVFVYCGLLVWQYFSRAFSDAAMSVVTNAHIVTKIYFPRMLLPIASVIAALPEFLFSLLALVLLMFYYQVSPGWQILLVPFFVVAAVLIALAVGLIFGSVYVLFRDVAQLLPFTIQLWMFLTPIIYPATLVPEAVRWIYYLNPMAMVVEGARWGFAGSAPPELANIGLGVFTMCLLMVFGVFMFRRLEPKFGESI